MNTTARPWAGYLIIATGFALLTLTCSGKIHSADYPIPPPPGGSVCRPQGPHEPTPGISCDCWEFRGLEWWWHPCSTR